MKTSLARTIENNADYISYDALCKQLLSEKSILAWIMKYCVSECQEMAVEDIIRCIEASPSVSAAPVFPDEKNTTLINGMNTVNTSHDEGTVAFDILFAAMIPSSKPMRLIINVEAQADFNSHYPLTSRAEYYSQADLVTERQRVYQSALWGHQKGLFYLGLYQSSQVQGEYDLHNFGHDERAIWQNEQTNQRLWLVAYGLHHAWE